MGDLISPAEAQHDRYVRRKRELAGYEAAVAAEITKYAGPLAEAAVVAYARGDDDGVRWTTTWLDATTYAPLVTSPRAVVFAAADLAHRRGYATQVVDLIGKDLAFRVSPPPDGWLNRLWWRLCGWRLP
jgi:hypothetical protein